MAATKQKNVTASEAAASAEPIDAPVPTVEPRNVNIDPGLHFRHVLVRLPKGMIGDDLRNPKIWRRVQAVRQSALIKFDRLLLVAFDESWACEAIVKHATNTEASLVIHRIFGFRDADESLFSDGTFEVCWDGCHYQVRRIADRVQVSPYGFSSEGMAIEHLRQQHNLRQ